MPKLGVALIVGAGLILWSFISKSNVINSLRILINRIHVEFSGLSPVITLYIVVQNPTNDTFTIYSLAGDVYVNGNFVGNVSNFTKFTVERNSQLEVPIVLKLSIVSLISQVVDIVTGKSAAGGTVQLRGNINLDNQQFPVDIAYKII
jgi:LEA14-like dessication related protein